ncbi:hypothetical protein [Nocardioides mangrovi]|uniref:M20/M25/M40 family metallo-hydrolase n=1 Tax=Nocardioides mangrovi TaxID=2874580 RepID=A0ABS7UAR0_9ACTN|nr:hypothetical protein [Nocardioides mangrovi]MBZ5737955.1 hypothetical protein [Nocardioides mangrovi]
MSDPTLPVMPLLLELDVVSLTMSLVNIPSETGAEDGLAAAIEAALAPLAHLAVERVGNTVVARTPDAGVAERVLVAGHLDTDPGDPDSFAYVEMGKLFGIGACDAKGGLAVLLRSAAATPSPGVTFVLHAGGGLATLAETRPELLAADVAVLVAPTSGGVADPTHPAHARLAGLADTAGVPASADRQAEVDLLVARGIPTVSFGPGDPAVAHAPGEFVPTAELTQCEYVLRTWLEG